MNAVVPGVLARCGADELCSVARVSRTFRAWLDENGVVVWLALCEKMWPGAAAALDITAASASLSSAVAFCYRLRGIPRRRLYSYIIPLQE